MSITLYRQADRKNNQFIWDSTRKSNVLIVPYPSRVEEKGVNCFCLICYVYRYTHRYTASAVGYAHVQRSAIQLFFELLFSSIMFSFSSHFCWAERTTLQNYAANNWFSFQLNDFKHSPYWFLQKSEYILFLQQSISEWINNWNRNSIAVLMHTVYSSEWTIAHRNTHTHIYII